MNIKQKISDWFFKSVDLKPRSLITIGNTVYTDAICEKTADVGVDIDGLLIKDGISGSEPRIAALRSQARVQLKNAVQMTNDPEMLDGTKKEYVAGNITTDKNKMEVKGGSSTSKGWSWMYWDITATTELYVRARLKSIDCWTTMIQLCDASGATTANPPDFYDVHLHVEGVNKDFKLSKTVSGVYYDLMWESIDLSFGEWYDVELYFKGDGAGSNTLMVWRDGILKFNFSETETEILNIQSVRFVVSDNNEAAFEKGHFGKPFIILYQ